MSITERTIACRICGEPYVFYAFYAGDQSACPDCLAKARKHEATSVGSQTIRFPRRSPTDEPIGENDD